MKKNAIAAFRLDHWVNTLGPLIGLAFVYALFAALTPETFCTWANTETMLRLSAVVGATALGMTVIIIAGGIDLSVGSAIALGTVVIAKLLQSGAGIGAAALGGVATTLLCGLLIGGLITWLRLTPFIVTLGMMLVLRGLAEGLGGQQVVSPPRSYADTDSWLSGMLTSVGGEDRWQLLPVGVWLTLLLAAIVWGILRFTRFGRHVYAVGSNVDTARLCGVRVERVQLGVYALAGACVGWASVLQFSRLSIGDPTTAAGFELDAIAAVVIGGGSLAGGEGSIRGTLIGVLIMEVVGNGCTKLGLESWFEKFITGIIIVIAVTLDQWRRQRLRRLSG